MCWRDFKRFGIFILVAFTFTQCSEKGVENNASNEQIEHENQTELSEEQKIVRQVENELKISAAENYDISIQYDYLNSDTLKDALILVNRKEHAFEHVKKNHTENFFEKTGNTAPFNYVFVKLGGQKRIIPTTPVGSNVNYPLEANFLELTSKAFKDFYVDYRIRNSMQRNYYTVRNNQIHLTFSCPIFDSIGEKHPVVYDIQHKTSSVRLPKDIALYYATFKDYSPLEIADINHFVPSEIIPTDKLYVYFIFDEKTMKYKTPMKPLNNEE